MNPYITQQLAAGRQAELRRNAEQYRFVKQAAGARRARRSAPETARTSRFGRLVGIVRPASQASADCAG